MPADSELWIPPLSPKAQKRFSGRYRGRKAPKRLSGFTKRFMHWFSFSGKTFWDILSIIAIPVVVAVVTMQFSAQQSETSNHIAQDQQQESALQTYLDHMSDLLLNSKLHESQPGDEVRNVARARTLTVLPQLNGKRKRAIVQFLYEAHLIGFDDFIDNRFVPKPSILDLKDADLSGIDLSYIGLNGADLDAVDLTGANLYFDTLDDVDLSYAFLKGADLRYANLDKAKLRYAVLYGANLSNAFLSYAVLSDAYVDQDQLKKAKSLEGATMPDGSIHP